MKNLTHNTIARSVTPEISLQHMPPEVLQKIFRYVPLQTLTGTVSRVNRGFLTLTKPWRNAIGINVNIQAFQQSTNNQFALTRFKSLMDECMQTDLPDFVVLSLINGLIETLPRIPAAEQSQALSALFGQCVRLPKDEGQQVKMRAMKSFLDSQHFNRKLNPNLPKFEPADDEQAGLAASVLSISLPKEISFSTLKSIVFENDKFSNSLALELVANLLKGINWAGRESNVAHRASLLMQLSTNASLTLKFLLAPPFLQFFSRPEREELQEFSKGLFKILNELIAGESILCQLHLISHCTTFANFDSTQKLILLERGRWFVANTSEDQLIQHWGQCVLSLCSPSWDINWTELMIERASSFSEVKLQVQALKTIASRVAVFNEIPMMNLIAEKIRKIDSRTATDS